MKILHVAAHLGGGIGKAHAAINHAMPAGVEQTYVLLEAPVDLRHVNEIRQRSQVAVTDDASEIVRLASRADVVQFEFWGHPRLAVLLKCLDLTGMGARTACWSHVSGTSPPLVPDDLLFGVDRFAVTSPVSVAAIGVGRCVVVNSGFGFWPDDGSSGSLTKTSSIGTCYLGTVDFKKMHRGIFDVVDAVKSDEAVSFWGHVGPGVEAAVSRMKHPERVRLLGHTLDPAAAMHGCGTFLYPLRPNHYGTAENSLVEAMSLGLVPVVMDNPAELEIVRHGRTGLVARSVAGLAAHLNFLASSPAAREILSSNAVREIRRSWYSPARSAKILAEMWRDLITNRGAPRSARLAPVSPPPASGRATFDP